MDLSNVNIRGSNMRAENDKAVYAVLALYRNPKMREARVSLSVFSSEKKGAPLFEAQFSRAWIAATKLHFGELMTAPKDGAKFTATVSKRVRDQNGFKSEKVGTLTYGLDRGGAAYIGVTTDQGAYKFPLRTDLNYTYSDELPQSELNKIGITAFLDAVDAWQRIADMCMLQAAEPSEGGGGWKGNGGGGNGGGWKGRNNGGGGWKGNGGGGNGGNSDVSSDEIAF